MQNNKLEKTLPDSLGTELTNISTNLMEVGVDAVIENGVLKDIPIVGSIVEMIKAGVSVKERFYVRKLITFLNEFKNIDETLRIKFISEELNDDSKKEKFGETILALIEKSDDLNKFKLYAKIFEMHFNGKCTYDDSIRMCSMIEKAFFSDLLYICNFKNNSLDNQLVTGELYKVGFLTFAGIDGGEFGKEESGGMIYKINKYGSYLKEIICK
jgi:hypothetical protein